jgi:hypothetical protein
MPTPSLSLVFERGMSGHTSMTCTLEFLHQHIHVYLTTDPLYGPL